MSRTHFVPIIHLLNSNFLFHPKNEFGNVLLIAPKSLVYWNLGKQPRMPYVARVSMIENTTQIPVEILKKGKEDERGMILGSGFLSNYYNPHKI